VTHAEARSSIVGTPAQSSVLDTLPKLLLERARQTPDQVAVREKDFGIWQEMTWAEYLEQVKLFSLGLRTLGLQRGDKVAIIGDNRPEWFIAELAAQSAGAASVGLFQDAIPREVQYIVDHGDARFVVVEDQEQVDKLLEVKDQLPKVERIVYYDPKGLRHYAQPFLLSFAAVQELGRQYDRAQPGAFEAAVAEGRGSDLAVLCYHWQPQRGDAQPRQPARRGSQSRGCRSDLSRRRLPVLLAVRLDRRAGARGGRLGQHRPGGQLP
jgi:long-subunit acyl-CoA synthetase (AMP-forming)